MAKHNQAALTGQNTAQQGQDDYTDAEFLAEFKANFGSPKKLAFAKAYLQCMGVIKHAADKSGVSMFNHFRWMKNDPEYKRVIDAMGELVLDMAETGLQELAESRDFKAIRFLLINKGAHRGYRPDMAIIADAGIHGQDIAAPPTLIVRPAPKAEPPNE